MTTTGKTSANPTNSYPSHKTISLAEEKTIVNTEIPPAIVKENKPVAEIKPLVTENAKDTYLSHKTVTLAVEKDTVNKEAPPVVLNENKPVAEIKPVVTEKSKESYLTHKTFVLTEEKTAVSQEIPVVVKENKPVVEIKTTTVTENTKTSYLAHKTVNIEKEQSTVNQEVKKEETIKQTLTGKLDSLTSNLNTNELLQKTTDVVKEQPVVQKLEDTVKKTSDFIKEPPVVQQLEDAVPKTPDFIKNQPELPKVNEILQKTENVIKEQPVIQKVDDTLQKTTNFVKEQPLVQKIETTVNQPITATINQIIGSTNYPAHKTFILEPAAIKQETVNQVKEEAKPPVTVQEPLIAKDNKQEPVTTVKSNLPQGAYPEHKTFYFVREESTNPVVDDVKQKVIAPDSNESVSAETKPAAVKTTTIAPAATTPAAKAKKPIVWIAASAALLLTSGATAWYAYQQKKNMQEEITVLKQSNETLAENVKRLQKDLHFDDIIARAGKLDAKNNITVIEDANASEIVRTCFSITPNAQAKRGKKLVYIRFTDAAGKLLANGKEATFEYKGAQTPYSVKQEIDYKGSEMMLCVDFKPTEKLQKGTYKAEIYNEGVLDGTSTFELK